MKRYLFLFLFLSLSLVANPNPEAKILHYIIENINNNSFQKIWSDDASLRDSFRELGYGVTKDAKDADLIIVKKRLPLKGIKAKVFVLNYNLLNKIPRSFGAFFWKKGRPNIVFISPRVKREHLKLSKELQAYEEEQVW